MNITPFNTTVREVAAGYRDSGDEGVRAFGGKLDVRPAYQREFIYRDKQREAVIGTINKGFPLNVMYWADNGDGTFGILDGQQRTISFCQYVAGDFAVDYRFFHNLTGPEKDKILDYPLMVYLCVGDDRERLDWFRTINIAGVKLTEQELRNVVYPGPWLSHAKTIFSKRNCAAEGLLGKYVNGSAIRQELLETAIAWVSSGNVDEYMALHQHDPNANQLWAHYQNVIRWAEATFPQYHAGMKGVDWNALYKEYGGKVLDTAKLEAQISRLLMDDDVTSKKGIWPYVLTRDEKHLNIRAFTPAMKAAAYERQGGVCALCGKTFTMDMMDGDHILPWHRGGKTTPENCQMLCVPCNRGSGR